MKENPKVCVVTGASGGIGQETVKKFYQHGYDVVMLSTDEKKLRKVMEENGFDPARVSTYALDVSCEEQVAAVVDAVKQTKQRIDVLVNTASILGKYDTAIDCTVANFKRIYEVNVFGTFMMMHYALPIMVEQRSGSIINFGSVSGMTGYTFEIGYGSSKWAIIGMTKNVANEYGQYGIRAKTVSPGWVYTAIFRR